MLRESTTADAYFDPLIADRSAPNSSSCGNHLLQVGEDVDQWLGRVASANPGVAPAPPTAVPLGAASLPLDGAVIRPGRRRMLAGRSDSTALDHADADRSLGAQGQRAHRIAVAVVVVAGTLLALVVTIARPAGAPGPQVTTVRDTSGLRELGRAVDAAQRSVQRELMRRDARTLARRRAAARERGAHRSARRVVARRRARPVAAPVRRPTPPPVTAPPMRQQPPTPRDPRSPRPPAPSSEFEF